MKSRKLTTLQKVRIGVGANDPSAIDSATATYKSSNPRVASVKVVDEKGWTAEIIAHRPGKTMITTRIKQNGKTIKVTRHTFTVVRPM